jgi:hypothetical protein
MRIEISPFPKMKPLPKWLIWLHYHVFKFGFEIHFFITWCTVMIKINILWLYIKYHRCPNGSNWWKLEFFNSRKLSWGNLP